MKVIYLYDDNGYFAGGKWVDDTYQLQPGETVLKPSNDLYDPKWTGKTWTGSDKETWEAQQLVNDTNLTENIPLPSNNPTPLDKTLAMLTLQIAQNKADQDKLNAQLLLATAAQTVGGE
jgi:hypothetical protein